MLRSLLVSRGGVGVQGLLLLAALLACKKEEPPPPVQPAPVVPAAAPVAAGDKPSFTVDSTSVAAGSEVTVTFSAPMNAPAGQQYWITIAPQGSADSEWGTWEYVKPGASKVLLTPKTAGSFEIRLHDLYPQNSSGVLHRTALTVK